MTLIIFGPIALLSTSFKTFDSAKGKCLNSFSEKRNIYDDTQNGFRKKRSTIFALYN